MVTVCLITCVILGLFFGVFIGHDMAFKRFVVIVDALCISIDNLVFGKDKNNVEDVKLHSTEREKTEEN